MPSIKEDGCCEKSNMKMGGNASGGAVYGMGFVGAAVYFIQNADSFGMGVYGVLKAIVWPALLIYKALQNFNF